MKTAFPKHVPSRPPQPCRGLTILEMLVSTALLSFIVLGLTAMFIQTQKAFKTGIKQTTITDAGRSILDMIASDLSQMSDPHFTNTSYYAPSGVYSPCPTLSWSLVPYLQFAQGNMVNGVFVQTRLNQSEDIFATLQSNATWVGVGYTVSNWFASSSNSPFPGVGTLYRYVATTSAPLSTNNQLYGNFNIQIGLNTFTNTLFHRIADGVVHLKIYAFDADGNEMPWQQMYDSGLNTSPAYQSYQYPTTVINPTNSSLYLTNYLPHSIDIELGILEPEALEHARALYASGATVAASSYLATAVGQVEIFRQHIIIPAAP